MHRKEDRFRKVVFSRFDIEFNEIKATSLGVKISRRPDIPSPEKKIKKIEISGRDGDLIDSNTEYKDIEIPVEMNFVKSPMLWNEQYRKIKSWILQGTGKLKFSDDVNVFYKVKNTKIADVSRDVREAGKLKVMFLCDPCTYILSGLTECRVEDVQLNNYYECHPIYKVTGEGMCTLAVNKKSMTANVGQNLTIDTELMLAYRKDGTLNNTAVTGKYEDLYLKSGENAISISPGFDLKIIPNWRCL